MSRSVKPARRSRSRSSSSTSQGCDRQLHREIEHGALALVEPRGAIVHHHHLAEHGIAELAHAVAVRGDAVEAAVLRRHHRGDHLDLELGEVLGVLHQLLPIVDERLQLGVVERKGLEHVRHEAELFVALLEIGLHLAARAFRAQASSAVILMSSSAPLCGGRGASCRRRAAIAWSGTGRFLGTFFAGLFVARRVDVSLSSDMRRDPTACSAGGSGYRSSPRGDGDRPRISALDAAASNGKDLHDRETPRRANHVQRAPRETPWQPPALPAPMKSAPQQALIAAAGKILSDDNREVPEDFVAGLFALRGARKTSCATTRASSPAWRRMPGRCSPCASRERRRSASRPRGRRPAPLGGRAESVLEIVNDDMPFLVDSVLGELAERGVDVRFVVHPVFTVERDAAGRLTAFKGTRAARRRAARKRHPHPCRAHRRGGATRRDRRGDRAGARRRPRLRRRTGAR